MTTAHESRLAGARLEELAGSDRLDLIQRWDPVGLVLTGHGVTLLVLGSVARPAVALGLIIALAAWRAVTGLGAQVWSAERANAMLLAREAGSLVLAAAILAFDGGTESPFFFWPLVLLAWCALRFKAGELGVMVAITVVSYVVVVIAASDVTPTSTARLGLLAAFSGVLILVRSRMDFHRGEAEYTENLLQEAIDVTPAALVVLSADDDFRPSYINSAAVEMGLSPTSETGSLEVGELRRLVSMAWEEGKTVGPDLVTIQNGHSSPRHIRLIATPHERSGRRMVVVSAEDVTHQVEVGEERRSFFRFAGHQLRTPLTPIIAYAEMLKAGDLHGEAASRAADEINHSALELLRLLERMLAVADLQHGTDTLIVATRVGAILQSLEAPGLDDGVKVAGDPSVTVVCNRGLVARALTELIENSHQFGTPPVHLEWDATGDGSVEFRLWDEGPGPDLKSSADLMFAEWGSLDPEKMMTPGMRSRLGLVQARLLVSLSDGDLTFHRGDDASWWFSLRFNAGSESPVGVH